MKVIPNSLSQKSKIFASSLLKEGAKALLRSALRLMAADGGVMTPPYEV